MQYNNKKVTKGGGFLVLMKRLDFLRLMTCQTLSNTSSEYTREFRNEGVNLIKRKQSSANQKMSDWESFSRRFDACKGTMTIKENQMTKDKEDYPA